VGTALVWEILMTAFLLFVVIGVIPDVQALGIAAPLARGAIVGADALFGIPVTSTGINPAGPSAQRSRQGPGPTSGCTSSVRPWEAAGGWRIQARPPLARTRTCRGGTGGADAQSGGRAPLRSPTAHELSTPGDTGG
jgi:Major intrinsic protein